MTVQTTYTATTSMMPAAMENRNEVFITDHGSSRDSRSRAFRVRRAPPARALAAADVSAGLGATTAAGTAGRTAVLGPAVSSSFAGSVLSSGLTSGVAGCGNRDWGAWAATAAAAVALAGGSGR